MVIVSLVLLMLKNYEVPWLRTLSTRIPRKKSDCMKNKFDAYRKSKKITSKGQDCISQFQNTC